MYKKGIWTEHVTPDGRKFYFNMVHGRSYWTLPSHLLSEVQYPIVNTSNESITGTNDTFNITADQNMDNTIQQKKRETLLASIQNDTVKSSTISMDLQERMALAAQKKKAEEIKRITERQLNLHNDTHTNTNHSQDPANAKEYLDMVRHLKDIDKETDTTGGKWLVR